MTGPWVSFTVFDFFSKIWRLGKRYFGIFGVDLILKILPRNSSMVSYSSQFAPPVEKYGSEIYTESKSDRWDTSLHYQLQINTNVPIDILRYLKRSRFFLFRFISKV